MTERICFILLCSLLYFFKTLGYRWVSDDLPSSQSPKDPNKWKQRLFVFEGRARSHPQTDHFITTIIHSLVCVCIYTGFGASDTSFLAAFLFMVNPANNQGSVWIAGRAYALSALGMTFTMTFPIMAPIALWGTTYFNPGFLGPLALAGSPHAWVVCFLPFCWLFHRHRFYRNVTDKIKNETFAEDRKFGFNKFKLTVKTFGFYLVHAIFPIKNTFYHSFLESAAGSRKHKAHTMNDRFFWIGLFGIIGIFYFWLSRPWGAMSFYLLWWCVCIAPFLNLFRMHQEIAERYMYLPNVGMMMFLATILQGYPVITSALLTAYAVKMWFYMDAYQDDYYLIENACLNSPDSWFAWHVRGMRRWDVQSYKEAIIMWTMARRISPKEFKVNFNLASALVLTKHQREGLEFLKIAEANIPGGQEEQSKQLIADFRAGKITILL
jgi:hypothetical protein